MPSGFGTDRWKLTRHDLLCLHSIHPGLRHDSRQQRIYTADELRVRALMRSWEVEGAAPLEETYPR